MARNASPGQIHSNKLHGLSFVLHLEHTYVYHRGSLPGFLNDHFLLTAVLKSLLSFAQSLSAVNCSHINKIYYGSRAYDLYRHDQLLRG